MFNINVPNGTQECTKLEMNPDFNIDNMIIDIIGKSARGSRQFDLSWALIKYGFVFYDDLYEYPRKRFDNYITKVQEAFRKYYPNAHIYYGRIGANDEFGYYLQVAP